MRRRRQLHSPKATSTTETLPHLNGAREGEKLEKRNGKCWRAAWQDKGEGVERERKRVKEDSSKSRRQQ